MSWISYEEVSECIACLTEVWLRHEIEQETNDIELSSRLLGMGYQDLINKLGRVGRKLDIPKVALVPPSKIITRARTLALSSDIDIETRLLQAELLFFPLYGDVNGDLTGIIATENILADTVKMIDLAIAHPELDSHKQAFPPIERIVYCWRIALEGAHERQDSRLAKDAVSCELMSRVAHWSIKQIEYHLRQLFD